MCSIALVYKLSSRNMEVWFIDHDIILFATPNKCSSLRLVVIVFALN